MRSKLIRQLRQLLGQAENPNATEAVGVVGDYETEYAFDLNSGRRSELISQLRAALSNAESPQNDFVEFELLDSGFCIEFDE